MVIWNRVKLKKGYICSQNHSNGDFSCYSSNVICMVFILESSKKQITDSVKHTMVDVINTTSKIVENEISNADTEDLDYDEYAKSLSDVKLEGMDSSYVYVVKNDGTMLYHPTKEKVGQPVENAVIKGVVQQLQDGKNRARLL